MSVQILQGDAVRAGPLNWSQLDWLLSAPANPSSSPDFNQVSIIDTPGLPAADVLEALRVCIGRHESLRTILENVEPSCARQLVMARPQSASELSAIVDLTLPESTEERFGEAVRHYFDTAKEGPVRCVLSVDGGRVQKICIVVDHSATDAWGMEVIRRELGQLLLQTSESGDALQSLVSENRILQPLDLASWERSPAGEVHSRRAEQFWTKQLRTLQEHIAGVVSSDSSWTTGDGSKAALFRRCRVISKRLLQCAQQASLRAQAPISSIFLAAFGRVLCRKSGQPVIGIQVECANRATEEARYTASKMVMRAPVVLRALPEEASMRALIAECAPQQIKAQRWSHADPLRIDLLRRSMLPHYFSLDVAGPVFNYTNDPVAAEPSPMGHGYDVIWLDPRPRKRDARKRLRIRQGREWISAEVHWREDLLSLAEAEEILQGVVDEVELAGRGVT